MAKRRARKNPVPGPWYFDRYELKIDTALTLSEVKRGRKQEYVVIQTLHPAMGMAKRLLTVNLDTKGLRMYTPEKAEEVAEKMARKILKENPDNPNLVDVRDHRGHPLVILPSWG